MTIVLKVNKSRKKNCRAVTSSKKTNETHELSWVRIVRFLEEVTARQFYFEINWPLEFPIGRHLQSRISTFTKAKSICCGIATNCVADNHSIHKFWWCLPSKSDGLWRDDHQLGGLHWVCKCSRAVGRSEYLGEEGQVNIRKRFILSQISHKRCQITTMSIFSFGG